MSTDATRAEHDESATSPELVAGTVGDRCTSCQQSLAADQRYCVNCGQRRGKPRFSFESLAAPASPAPGEIHETRPRRTRVSSATTLVAGVATLLLALGVGVLIGHNSNSSPTRAAASPQIITVGGGGGTAAGALSSTGASVTASKHHGKAAKVKTVTVHISSKVKAKAASAAAKVFGNNGGNLVNNPTQQVGGACSGGAGCQGGKFTGNFFGGG